jgi:hypothetical protein
LIEGFALVSTKQWEVYNNVWYMIFQGLLEDFQTFSSKKTTSYLFALRLSVLSSYDRIVWRIICIGQSEVISEIAQKTLNQ